MRLIRPAIPLKVRCRVALRQLGEMFIDDVIEANRGRYGALLGDLLHRLSELLHPGASIRFHLDHDPPLGARQKVFNKAGEHVDYLPAANDPEFLIYREEAAHGIKTRVRGEHGQYSDLTLIKRSRRREKKPKKKRWVWRSPAKSKKHPKPRWASRPFPKRKK